MEDVVMFGGVFDGRRVLVTGHTGFKGSWLTLWLLDLGAHVTGLALGPPTDPSLYDILRLTDLGEGRLKDRRGDVRDVAFVRGILAEADPEVVFHLAAQPMVRRSYAEPRETFEINVMGTVDVLEAAKELAVSGRGPRVIVNVTTDKCYENLETVHAYVETDALGGLDPYSSSKACAELVTAAYRRSFFAAAGSPALATARAGNVLGGGDWGEDRILPDCIRALGRGETVKVRNPGAVRPWQHVLESLSGYLCLAAALWRDPSCVDGAGSAAGAWNFGPGPDCRVSVREVVEAVVREWGAGEWRPAADSDVQPHEAGLLVLDAGRAERELGWRAAWDVDMAVAAAVSWYREWADDASAARLVERCRADITAYAGAATRAGASWARPPSSVPVSNEGVR